MFKTPDKHHPRERGNGHTTPLPVAIALGILVITALAACAFLPYGPEIAIVLGGIALGILVYRESGKPGN